MSFIRPCARALIVTASLAASAAAANITSVVETGGDNEATDTITAKWSGQTWTVTVDNEPVPGVTIGQSYTAGLFGDLAPAFVDRNHRYFNDPAGIPIPGYLVGQEYIISGNDNRDNATYKLDVTIAQPSTVYMLIDNRLSDGANGDPPTFDATHMQWILDQGWAATDNGLNRSASASVPDEVAFDEGADGGVNQWFSVYERKFLAGTFSLLQADNGGRNMYGAVVVPDVDLVVGDVNGDQVVDILDFGIIRDNFRTGTSPEEGDLNFDGDVDFADFQIWKTAFGGGGPSSVPEPGAFALVACGLLGALGRSLWRRTRGLSIAALMMALSAAPASAAIVNVVETGGDNEATDTITAKWSGQTWAATVANEPIPGAVVGQNYTAGVFDHLAPAFVDRNHRYYSDVAGNLPIPGYLIGNEYILSGNDNRDNVPYQLEVTISTASTVYMLIDNRLSDASNANPPTFDATHMQWILDQGWIPTANGLNRTADPSAPDEVAFDEGADDTINQYYSIYQKDFPAGTFSLLQADNGGQNMYGVVVKAGGQSVAGDVNGDQVVDIDDFDIIRTNFRIGTTPEQGDLDFSGLVDLNDFKIWKNAFGGGGPASVPEPSTFALLCLGLTLAAARRARRHGRLFVAFGAALLGANNALAQSTIVFNVNGAADWNLQSSWIDPLSQQTFIPGDNFPDEVPGINNGGTPFLSTAALFPVGGVLIAETGGSSGRLEIRNGGSLNIVAGSTPAANGSMTVGQNGAGTLSMQGNGSLTATSLTVAGAAASALEASGTAKITISGNANLARNTRLLGPNVDFDVGGNLTVNGTYQPTINGPDASVIAVTGSANIGGRLNVVFDGVTPAFGNSWLLINAANANGKFTSVTSNTLLPRGLVLESSVNAGGSGDVSVRVGNRLILSVDRASGATTISNVAGGAIALDGYAIGSAGGSLDAAQWESLEDQNVGDWLEAAPTDNNLSELNPFGGSNLLVGQSLDLGNPYQFAPTAFGQSGDDVTFDYSTPEGGLFQGIVEYTGPHNTLVLVVDPDTGDTVLQNQSTFDATIDGYTVASASGSLQFGDGTWLSLQDQNLSDWEEANPSANYLSELNPTDSTLFSGGQTVNLGTLFDVAGERDLTLEFHLTTGESMFGVVEYGEPIVSGQDGDTDSDGDVDLDDLNAVRNNFGDTGPIGGTAGDAFPFDGEVDLDDLNAVRNNFGAAGGSQSVPEPASLVLAAMTIAIAGCVAQARRHRVS